MASNAGDIWVSPIAKLFTTFTISCAPQMGHIVHSPPKTINTSLPDNTSQGQSMSLPLLVSSSACVTGSKGFWDGEWTLQAEGRLSDPVKEGHTAKLIYWWSSAGLSHCHYWVSASWSSGFGLNTSYLTLENIQFSLLCLDHADLQLGIMLQDTHCCKGFQLKQSKGSIEVNAGSAIFQGAWGILSFGLSLIHTCNIFSGLSPWPLYQNTWKVLWPFSCLFPLVHLLVHLLFKMMLGSKVTQWLQRC